MIDLSELHSQNHRIQETAKVYRYLVGNRAMCDTEVAGCLLFDYAHRVEDHLEQVDRHLSTRLLTCQDPRAQIQARKFLAESLFLKKLLADYVKRWSRKEGRQLLIKDHARFLKDTDEMVDLVLDRIQRETEHLYPLWDQRTPTVSVS